MQEDNNLLDTDGADALAGEKQFEAWRNGEEAEKPAEKEDKPGAEKQAAAETVDDDAGKDAGEQRSKSGSARWREKARSLEAELARTRQQLEEVRASKPKPPALEEFGYDTDKFNAASAEFSAELVARTIREQMAESEAGRLQRERAEVLMAHHADRVSEAREKLSDFDKVVAKASTIQASLALNEAIYESDKSALLLYHLAARPEEVAELSRMPIAQMARRIGQIEARLSYPSQRTETKAPPPVSGLRGGAIPQRGFTTSMSGDQYATWREG